ASGCRVPAPPRDRSTATRPGARAPAPARATAPDRPVAAGPCGWAELTACRRPSLGRSRPEGSAGTLPMRNPPVLEPVRARILPAFFAGGTVGLGRRQLILRGEPRRVYRAWPVYPSTPIFDAWGGEAAMQEMLRRARGLIEKLQQRQPTIPFGGS